MGNLTFREALELCKGKKIQDVVGSQDFPCDKISITFDDDSILDISFDYAEVTYRS